jgi:protein-L-isoaspartate(D-aspartate) O-methyltransferase
MTRDDTGTHGWRELSVWFATWQQAQATTVNTLGPRFVELETRRMIDLWWFVRKGVEWRIRYLPEPGGDDAAATLGRILDTLTGQARCTRWAHTIYEPPTAAFGGPDTMTTVHKLFHADSRHVLNYLASGGGHQRELGILLAVAMFRAAHRDWYDQGHIWHLLTRERTRPVQPPTPASTDALHRLLTADLDPAKIGVSSSWIAAFAHAGTAHFDLDRQGITARGLNAVLAHHVIYAWNRLGLTESVQGAIVHTAARLVFDDYSAPGTAARRAPPPR